jgi:hypothetical protein
MYLRNCNNFKGNKEKGIKLRIEEEKNISTQAWLDYLEVDNVLFTLISSDVRV